MCIYTYIYGHLYIYEYITTVYYRIYGPFPAKKLPYTHTVYIWSWPSLMSVKSSNFQANTTDNIMLHKCLVRLRFLHTFFLGTDSPYCSINVWYDNASYIPSSKRPTLLLLVVTGLFQLLAHDLLTMMLRPTHLLLVVTSLFQLLAHNLDNDVGGKPVV